MVFLLSKRSEVHAVTDSLKVKDRYRMWNMVMRNLLDLK